MIYPHSAFEQELTKLIDAEIERIREVLGAGNLKDFADYRHYTGQIAGLERVKVYCDEANTTISKR